MHFVFDVETTIDHVHKLDHLSGLKYRSSRIVAIAWIILNDAFEVVEQVYYVVRPYKFKVSRLSTSIHGITHNEALSNGKDLRDVLRHASESLSFCETIVSHNLSYDSNVLKNEYLRLNMLQDVERLDSLKQFCTMKHGKRLLNIKKNPNLGLLYSKLHGGKSIAVRHHALEDTKCCVLCYKKLAHA